MTEPFNHWLGRTKKRLESTMPATDSDVILWVIEYPNNGNQKPFYWGNEEGEQSWTADIEAAFKFDTAEAAEKHAGGAGIPDFKIVDRQWLDHKPPASSAGIAYALWHPGHGVAATTVCASREQARSILDRHPEKAGYQVIPVSVVPSRQEPLNDDSPELVVVRNFRLVLSKLDWMFTLMQLTADRVETNGDGEFANRIRRWISAGTDYSLRMRQEFHEACEIALQRREQKAP